MQLIDVRDCPCDGCPAKPCGHPARCVKFALWLNRPVNAVEVVHGRWDRKKHRIFGLTYDYVCSVCGCDYALAEYIYCPQCGAKMDGGVEDGKVD